MGYCFPYLNWFALVEETFVAGVCSSTTSIRFSTVHFLQLALNEGSLFIAWDSYLSLFAVCQPPCGVLEIPYLFIVYLDHE